MKTNKTFKNNTNKHTKQQNPFFGNAKGFRTNGTPNKLAVVNRAKQMSGHHKSNSVSHYANTHTPYTYRGINFV